MKNILYLIGLLVCVACGLVHRISDTKTVVNVGTNPNDGTGDPLRTAFIKINTEFQKYADDSAKLVHFADTVTGGKIATKAEIVDSIVNMKAGIYNVLDYGAKGDGSDDQPEIQAAFTAGIGGTVYFPKGTYYISAPLEIESNTVIKGEGPENTIIKARINWIISGAGMLTFLNNTHDIRLKNFCINGNNAAFISGIPRKKQIFGIYTYNYGYMYNRNISLENVEIKNTSQFGIGISANSSNWNLDNCYIHNTGDTLNAGGIYIATNGHGIKINNCRIDSTKQHGIYCADAIDISITNSFFRYNGLNFPSDDAGEGISMRADSGVVITGNNIMYNQGRGLTINANRTGFKYAVKDINVTGNNIMFNKGGVNTSTQSQVLLSMIENLVFANNNIGNGIGTNATNVGIYIYRQIKNGSIIGNNINSAYGVMLSGDSVYNVTIKDNHFSKDRNGILSNCIYANAPGPGSNISIIGNTGSIPTIGVELTSAYALTRTIIKNNEWTDFVYKVLNSSSATLHNIEYSGRFSFTSTETRNGIRIPGMNSDYEVIVTPRADGYYTRPVLGDLINAYSKTDSIIFMRQAGTTSGLTLHYRINNDDLQ